MKYLITIAVTIILLSGCAKEKIKTPEPKLIATSNNGVQLIFQYSGYFILDEIDFNPCTLEDVHITGTVPFQGQWVVVNGILNSNFHYHFDSVRGLGLTTGKTYIGNGTLAAFSKSTFDSSQTFLIQQEVSHIKFTSPLGIETSTLRLDIKSEAGKITVDREQNIFDDCK